MIKIIGFNKIGDTGFQSLIHKLNYLPRLQELDLSNINYIYIGFNPNKNKNHRDTLRRIANNKRIRIFI